MPRYDILVGSVSRSRLLSKKNITMESCYTLSSMSTTPTSCVAYPIKSALVFSSSFGVSELISSRKKKTVARKRKPKTFI